MPDRKANMKRLLQLKLIQTLTCSGVIILAAIVFALYVHARFYLFTERSPEHVNAWAVQHSNKLDSIFSQGLILAAIASLVLLYLFEEYLNRYSRFVPPPAPQYRRFHKRIERSLRRHRLLSLGAVLLLFFSMLLPFGSILTAICLAIGAAYLAIMAYHVVILFRFSKYLEDNYPGGIGVTIIGIGFIMGALALAFVTVRTIANPTTPMPSGKLLAARRLNSLRLNVLLLGFIATWMGLHIHLLNDRFRRLKGRLKSKPDEGGE